MKSFFTFAAVMSIALSGCAVDGRHIHPVHNNGYVKEHKPLVVEINGKKVSSNQYKKYITKKKNSYTLIAKPSMPVFIHDNVKYSFEASGDIKDVIRLFSDSNPHHHLNIAIDSGVKGKVDVSFRGLTLKESMDAILGSMGLYYVQVGHLIMVKDMQIKTFSIDYPRLVRTGKFSTKSKTSGSSQNGGSSGTTGGSSSSSANASGGSNNSGSESGSDISTNDKIDFWTDVENDIKALLSKDGKLSINKLAGTIVVNDHHTNVMAISNYIESTSKSVVRQAVIVAQILRVNGENNKKFNIDWNRLTTSVMAKTATAISNPFGVVAGISNPSINLTLQNTSGSIKAIISALKEQGNVEVVSNPQIRTLNNQPAMIKVGREQSFFRVTSIVNTTAAGAVTTTNDEQQDVTLGLLMSVTPQISEDGHITMDISPSVSSLTGTTTSANGSTAPIIDIQQLSSMVRVKSGESVVIGGLIQSTKSDTTRSVPVLGAIPFIGSLFTSKDKIDRDDELVIILTPYAVK